MYNHFHISTWTLGLNYIYILPGVGSYNAVNGVASCGNAKVQNEILRGQFGFDGYIVSDCGGVEDLGNARYPASQQCIANVDGKPFNDNRSSCFLPPLPEKGQTIAGVALNAGVSTHLGSLHPFI